MVQGSGFRVSRGLGQGLFKVSSGLGFVAV